MLMRLRARGIQQREPHEYRHCADPLFEPERYP
jgi:hypothetical protein